MALSAAQAIEVRRWMGWPRPTGDEDMVYSLAWPSSVSLTARLDSLTSDEETALLEKYLSPLAAIETGILAAQTNLDTQTAGPWIANPQEIAQRTKLYNQWRRDMCAFLGFPPGPALGNAGVTLVRC